MRTVDLVEEMASVSLGDRRLNRRVLSIVEKLQNQPGVGFPRALGTAAGLEAFYRLTNNERVDPDAILAPHRDQAWSRAASSPMRLVLHDTTEFSFGG